MSAPPRLFGILLRLLPAPLRRRHQQAVIDLAGEYTRGQPFGRRVWLWSRVAIDVAITAVAITLDPRLRSIARSRGTPAALISAGPDFRYWPHYRSPNIGNDLIRNASLLRRSLSPRIGTVMPPRRPDSWTPRIWFDPSSGSSLDDPPAHRSGTFRLKRGRMNRT